MELVGFADDHIEAGTKVFQSYIVLGTTDELKNIVRMYAIDEIIICVSNVTHERLLQLIEKSNETQKSFRSILISMRLFLRSKKLSVFQIFL